MKIRVSKMQSAQRQADTSIRMLFSGEDPVSIHTLTMASFRILRDLAEHQGNNAFLANTDLLIKKGQERRFWGGLQSFSNFLKHADRDPSAIKEGVDEKVNDGILFFVTELYSSLGNELTPEMRALKYWFIGKNPHLITDEAESKFLREVAEKFSPDLEGLSRVERLAKGAEYIEMAKAGR